MKQLNRRGLGDAGGEADVAVGALLNPRRLIPKSAA
jgi:hypothetical protein